MSKLRVFLFIGSLPFALGGAPAIAGPNVFWAFGLDRHYLHGAGGRAELPRKEQFASRRIPAPRLAIDVVEFAQASPVPIAPATIR